MVLHGQDGFGEAAAGRPPTPGSARSAAANGSIARSALQRALTDLPKAMDMFTPAGVDEASELDRSLGPVVLRGVPVQ